MRMNRIGFWGGWNWGWLPMSPRGCFPGEHQFRSWSGGIGWKAALAVNIGWRFPIQETAHQITGVVIHIQDRIVVLGMVHGREELYAWLERRPRRPADHPEFLKPWGIV